MRNGRYNDQPVSLSLYIKESPSIALNGLLPLYYKASRCTERCGKKNKSTEYRCKIISRFKSLLLRCAFDLMVETKLKLARVFGKAGNRNWILLSLLPSHFCNIVQRLNRNLMAINKIKIYVYCFQLPYLFQTLEK